MSHLDELFNLKNRIVVVTGGTGQLGTKICKAYIDMQAKVIALDKDISKGRLPAVHYARLDITRKEKVEDTFKKIFKYYGKVDILINNAGVSVFEPFEERKEKDLDLVMDVNLKGTFFCIQSYVNLFDRHKLKNGSIVNIASFYGVISPDFRIYTDCKRKSPEIYGATKAGIIQMTKYFAVHLAGRNIRVNAVSPGGIYNPGNPQGKDFLKNYAFRCPMKRMCEDNEVIGAILYLSADASSYTTGHNLVVDGGMSCW